jgi:hypothetical protein
MAEEPWTKVAHRRKRGGEPASCCDACGADGRSGAPPAVRGIPRASWATSPASPPELWPELVAAAKKAAPVSPESKSGAPRPLQVVFNVCGMEMKGRLIPYGEENCGRGHHLPHGRRTPRSTVAPRELASTLAKLDRRGLIALKEAAVHHMLVAVLAEDAMRRRL